MVERRVRPVAGAMALLAGLGETRGDVVGIRGPLEILQVAADARGGVERVVVVDVAIGTLPRRHCVQSRQWEPRRVVVEGRIRPSAGVVALVAGLREIGRDVIRVGRALEILQVAGHTRSATQCVVIVDVAIRALARRNGVQSSQHEAGHRMIELGIAPLHRVVAGFARVREPAVRHRSGRGGEIFLVTTETRHRTQGVIVVDMAVGALPRWDRVSSGQNKTSRAVVEPGNFSVQPVVCGMTTLAIGRELGLNVAGVSGRREVLQVA